MSDAVTSAPRAAAASATLPVPAATSRTRWPAAIPAALTSSRAAGSSVAATLP